MNKKDKKLAAVYLLFFLSGVLGGAGLMLEYIAELLDLFPLSILAIVIIILALIMLVITMIYEHEYRCHIKGDKP